MKAFTIAAVLMGALAIPAGAQELEEVPVNGVARLSIVSGDVIVRRGDSGEFIAGESNAPLVASDHVSTGEASRAEIQFDWANMLRLAANSEIRLGELADGNFFVQLADGTATLSVLRESSSLIEISTPTVSLRPLDKGTYRMTVRTDGSTQLTVRSGEAEIFTTGQTDVLRSGRTMEIRGDPEAPLLFALNEIPKDEWDRWNEARDRDLERSDSYRYVSRDIFGADDLAGHGRWVYDAPYGWVWAPRVAVSWAPYRAGRWCWIDRYGWTWVSHDPWGWAPYHYGRWYYASTHGWVWYPGAVGPRHYWQPALVAFFGWGSGVGVNVGVSFSFRNVGWVPLAPYEVYRPWYGRRDRTHVTVNNIVVNNVNVITNYRNARFNRGRYGVTSVPTRDFGRHPVTTSNFVRAHDRDLTRTGEVRGHLPFQPTTESLRFSDRTVTARVSTRPDLDDSQFVQRPRNPRAAADASIAPFTRIPEPEDSASVPTADRPTDRSGSPQRRFLRESTAPSSDNRDRAPSAERRSFRAPAVSPPPARNQPEVEEPPAAPPRRVIQSRTGSVSGTPVTNNAQPTPRANSRFNRATVPSSDNRDRAPSAERRSFRAPAVSPPPARSSTSREPATQARPTPEVPSGTSIVRSAPLGGGSSRRDSGRVVSNGQASAPEDNGAKNSSESNRRGRGRRRH